MPKKLKSLPAFARIIGPIRRVANEHGWAVAVHGSLDRDIDLVGIPWTRLASDRDKVLGAICAVIGGEPDAAGWRRRGHGRYVRIVRIPHIDPDTYLDFSFMRLETEPRP